MSDRATTHPIRPAQQRRRTYQFERLEDRLLMAVDTALLAVQANDTIAGEIVQSPPQPTVATRDTIELWLDGGEQVLRVLENDSGDQLRIVEATAPWFGGEMRIAEDGQSLLYAPPVNASRSANASYTVQGADGVPRTTTIKLYVSPRFEARRDSFEVDLGEQDVRLDVLANDQINDPSVDPLIVAVELHGEGGTFAVADDGKSLLFTAMPGFQGIISATYTVRIGPNEGEVVQQSVWVDVVRPFLAIDDWFAVDPADGAASLDVLANESLETNYRNIRGQERTLRIVNISTGDQGGQATIAADGKSLSYQAADGIVGDERFTYEIEDEFGNRDQATLTVHVTGEAAPAIATYKRAEWEVQILELAASNYRTLFGHVTTNSIAYWNYPIYAIDHVTFNLEAFATDGSLTNATNADHSQTNTQVAGVDEADLVETDGRYLYTFSDGKLTIVDAQNPSELRLVSVTALETSAVAMFLDGGRLTIVGRAGTQQTLWSDQQRTTVMVFDVSDAAAPQLVQHTEFDGRLVASRSIDGRVHLVLSQAWSAPALETVEVVHGDGSKSHRYETWEEYAERVHEVALDAALPGYESYDADQEVIASGALTTADEIVKPISSAGASLITVVAIDTHSDDPGPLSSVTWRDDAIANDSVYMSHDGLYVWSTEGSQATGETTLIRKIDIRDSHDLQLVATGRVDGRVVDQFSFDEHEGNLRVVTTSPTYTRWRLTAEVNDLYVLEQDGADLKVLGQVHDFADGESVRSVRFDGDRALVVTFPDQIFDPNAIPWDPLFVIDLSDPAAPTIEAELEVPGFSTYLQLINEDQLLGFGADIDPETGANNGVLLSLFHTNGLDQPQIIDQFRFDIEESERSIALDDHRAIAFYPEWQIVTVPITWREPIEGSAWQTRERGELWILQIDAESGKFELLSRVNHDTPALRSVRVGETLLAISGDTVSAHALDDVGQEIDRVYVGDLPRDDSYERTEDTGPWTLDVLTNDRLTEAGEQATIVAVTQPGMPVWNGGIVLYDAWYGNQLRGTVEIAEDGKSLLFTPEENSFGTATFTYTVFDAVRGEQTATVTINVEGVPDLPDAVNDEFEIAPGATAVSLNVLANDVDVDQNSLFSPVLWTDLEVLADVDRQLPQAEVLSMSDDSLALSSFASTDVMRSSLEADVYYLAIMPLKITSVSFGDQGGTVEIDSSGQNLIYTPAAGFEGVETFTYTIETSHGLTDTATVTVRVGDLAEVTDVTEATLATALATPAVEQATAPAELRAKGGSTQVVAPPATDLAQWPNARPGAVSLPRQYVSAAPRAAARSSLDLLRSTPRSTTHRASLQLAADEAFAGLASSDATDDRADDWDVPVWRGVAELLSL